MNAFELVLVRWMNLKPIIQSDISQKEKNKYHIYIYIYIYIYGISCFFNDPVDVGNLISGSSAFSKISLNIWKFKVHVLLKPGLENFEHYFTRV